MEEDRVELIAGHKSAKGLDPTDGPLYDPPSAIAAQGPAVLSGWSNAASAVRTNQFDPASGQSLSQGIAVRRAIIDQAARDLRGDGLTQQRLNESHFRKAGGVDVDGQGQTIAVDQNHELAAFAAFRGTDAIAPFFAEANVPSAKPSFQLTSPCWSSWWTNRSQAWSHTPLRDHFAKRRQQVTYDGKDRGKSFHRAPLRSTHRIPSRHCLAFAGGRPPRGSGWGTGKRSEISDHCSSVSCEYARQASGSILDPALPRDRSAISGLLSSTDTPIHYTPFS